MKLTTLLSEVASLVASRDIIDHGSIRMLHSEQACREIEAAEDCEEVETGTIGDDDLAEKLQEVIDDPEMLLEADADDLADAIRELYKAHQGDSVNDYLQGDEEDELTKLDSLIEAAQKFTAAL